MAAGICVDEIMETGEQGRTSHDQAKQNENEQVATTRVAFDLL